MQHQYEKQIFEISVKNSSRGGSSQNSGPSSTWWKSQIVFSCARTYVRAISRSKTVENQGLRANGHQIRILLIEIYKCTSFQPKRRQPAHVFNNFSIFWCVTFLFLAIVLFVYRDATKYSITKRFLA